MSATSEAEEAVTRRHAPLIAFLDAAGLPYRLLSHPVCRTSAESAAARDAAGAPGAVGAKALIIRRASDNSFGLLVLPGELRLRNDAVRTLHGKFRFATAEEVAEVTDGLQPGMIPPFGHPILPGIDWLMLDPAVVAAPVVGFNAAMFTRSVIMSGETLGRLLEGHPRVAVSA